MTSRIQQSLRRMKNFIKLLKPTTMIDCDSDCSALGRAALMKDSKTGITSESEYCQSTTSRDASIESNVETDEVSVIAEIYSMTDIPDSMRAEVQGPPRPGMVRADICDGKYVVLNSYRDKAVNTAELCPSEPGPTVPHQPTSPEVQKKVICPGKTEKRQKAVREGSPPGRRLAASYPSCLKYAQMKIKCGAPQCNAGCPNLIISEPAQTDDMTAVSMQPNDQGDSTCMEPAIPVPAKTPKPSSSLAAIEEQEEGPEIEEVTEEQLGMEDMAVGSEVTLDASKHIDTGDHRRPVFTAGLFETGTMLTCHSSTWLDRRRKRGDCGMIYTALSTECVYNNSKINCYGYCAKPVISRCVVQGNPQCSTSRSQMNCTSRCQVNRISAREKEAARCCDARALYRNPGLNDGWSSLETVHSQPCSVDTCQQSRPNRSDACNQYYLKSNTIPRYCWCRNGHVRQMNHYCANYCNTANQTFYRAPAYCYSYSW